MTNVMTEGIPGPAPMARAQTQCQPNALTARPECSPSCRGTLSYRRGAHAARPSMLPRTPGYEEAKCPWPWLCTSTQ